MTQIRDLMSKQIVAVSANASFGSAIKLMKQAHVSVVPVLNGNTLSGILTLEEAQNQQAENKISSVSLRQLYVEPNDEIEKAAKIMVDNKINRLPVVNNAVDMKCIGIITTTEVAKSHKERLF